MKRARKKRGISFRLLQILLAREHRRDRIRANTQQPGLPSLLPESSRIAFFGDSRTNYGATYTSGSTHYAHVQGFSGWMLGMLDGAAFMPIGANKGVVGNTLDQMDTRFGADIAPLNPKLLTIWGGINDLKGTSRTLAQMQANMNSIIAKARALSSKPVMFIANEPASSTITAGRETVRTQWNAWLATLAADDIVIFDAASEIDMADTNLSADQVHTNARGSYQIAKAWTPQLKAKISSFTYPTEGNFVTNSAFAGAGAMPTGWTVFNNGGGATVATQIVTKNGRKYAEVSITGTYTGSGKLVNLVQQSATTPAGIEVGDLIEGSAYVEVDAAAVSLNSVYFEARVGNARARIWNASADSPYPAEATAQLLRTPAINYTAGAGYIATLSVLLPNAAVETPVNIKARFALPVIREVPAGL